MPGDMLTMRNFLKDPIYRKWFTKEPYLAPHLGNGKPWWLYLQEQEEGKWRRAALSTYKQGFVWIQKHLKEVYDFSLTSKRRTYLPPVYRPVDDEGNPARDRAYWSNYPSYHNWCPYCRRPTVFAQFERHHADTEYHRYMTDTSEPRCYICGIRASAVKPWMHLR